MEKVMRDTDAGYEMRDARYKMRDLSRRLILVVGMALLTSCGNISKPEKVDLKKLEKIDLAEKIKLIQSLVAQFEGDIWSRDSLNNFHFVDLDNDHDRDLIYLGWTGGNQDGVRILVNQGDVKKKVFESMGDIQEIEFTENQLTQLTIVDPGCCAEYIQFTEEYRVLIARNEFEFKLTKRTALIDKTELPKDFFQTPIEFEVSGEGSFLRNSALIDTVDEWYGGEPGTDNIIAEFEIGTKGRALARATDSTGQLWWFVEIDSAFKPKKSQFYSIERTSIRGWMGSQLLKRL